MQPVHHIGRSRPQARKKHNQTCTLLMLFREGGTFQFQKLDKQTDSYFNTEFLQVPKEVSVSKEAVHALTYEQMIKIAYQITDIQN